MLFHYRNFQLYKKEGKKEKDICIASPLMLKQCVTLSNISFFLIFKINFIYLFIYFWLRWVFVAVSGLSVVAASEGYSLLGCAGFSLRWLLLLRSTGSRCAGFSSCGMRAQ